jgi:hypothetical protein
VWPSVAARAADPRVNLQVGMPRDRLSNSPAD